MWNDDTNPPFVEKNCKANPWVLHIYVLLHPGKIAHEHESTTLWGVDKNPPLHADTRAVPTSSKQHLSRFWTSFGQILHMNLSVPILDTLVSRESHWCQKTKGSNYPSKIALVIRYLRVSTLCSRQKPHFIPRDLLLIRFVPDKSVAYPISGLQPYLLSVQLLSGETPSRCLLFVILLSALYTSCALPGCINHWQDRYQRMLQSPMYPTNGYTIF